MDFSDVNLAYLLHARDLARQDPAAAGTLLGIPESLAYQFGELTPAGLVKLKSYKPPLIVPRHNLWWWERLLRALADGESAELQIILEHAGLAGRPHETTHNGQYS